MATKIASAGKGIVSTVSLQLFCAVASLVTYVPATWAQQGAARRIHQSQADSAERMIGAMVQRGIDSLPPGSGQLASYHFDHERDTFVREQVLGPTALRSPQTIARNRWDFRFSTSYFESNQVFEPIDYRLRLSADSPEASNESFTRLGLQAQARVTVLNFALSYGFLHHLEGRMNVPVTIVDAAASPIYFVHPHDRDKPASDAGIAYAPSREQLRQQIDLGRATCRGSQESGCVGLVRRRDSFRSRDISFPGGTNVGVGRTSMGVKAMIWSRPQAQAAIESDFLLPSPTADQLSGTDSFAFVPRLVGLLRPLDWLRLHADVGYEAQLGSSRSIYSSAPLNRLVWNSGVSVPKRWGSFDLGIGGSRYHEAIEWTPDAADVEDSAAGRRTGRLEKLGDQGNRIHIRVLDLLLGGKLRLGPSLLLSGAINVPLLNSQFRPAAAGTLAVEFLY